MDLTVSAPTSINVPQRAGGAARPSRAAHSGTELCHVHLTTRSLRSCAVAFAAA